MVSVRHVLLVLCLAGIAASSVDEAIVDEVRSALVVSQLALSQQSEVLQELVNAARTAFRLPDKEFSCPFPYTRVLDECFYVSKLKLNHSDARTHCQGMGGDLASPRNPYALASYLYDRGNISAHVGGAKTITNEYRWYDGRPVSPALWAPLQPSGYNWNKEAEDCIGMWSYKHPPVYDVSCQVVNIFVCKLAQ